MRTLTSDNYHKLVEKGTTIVYCWHEDCGSSRKLGPLLKDMESDYPELQFTRLNTHDIPEISRNLQVKFTPQLVVIRDGELSGRILHQNRSLLDKEFSKLVKTSTISTRSTSNRLWKSSI